MEVGGEVQFLGQIEGIKLQLERIEVRMEVGLILAGRNRTHMVTIFLHQGLFEEARMRLRPIRQKGRL